MGSSEADNLEDALTSDLFGANLTVFSLFKVKSLGRRAVSRFFSLTDTKLNL